jgi:predicted Zn-dependent peptidase
MTGMSRNKTVILLVVGFILMFSLLGGQQQLSAAQTSELRNDGLSIIQLHNPQDEMSPVCYLTMIIKTGYANDPNDKAGLTDLTNELFYYLLRNSSASGISYYTAAEFSLFNFTISRQNFTSFCSVLDFMIRQDALLLYDLCNQLTRDHLNEPHPDNLKAMINYHELIYGAAHPYLAIDYPCYRNLTISDVNNWFRLIYRPNNLIVAASSKLPTDFLRKPFGREIQELIKLPDIPVASPDIKKATVTTVHDNLNTIVIGFLAPRIDQDDCLTTILIQKYLQKELYDEICEKSGLCYDIAVSYSYIHESSVPTLTIGCQSLPEDCDLVVNQIIQVLGKLSVEGMPEDRENQILTKETQQMIIRYYSPWYAIQNQALQVYFDQEWIGDVAVYNDKLSQVSQKQVKKVIANGLKNLKISIAGPNGANYSLKELQVKVEALL